MAWTMPPETAPQERLWMAFPVEGLTLGETEEEQQAGYEAWAAVANAAIEFEPVTMVVDPSQATRARALLDSRIEVVEAPLDEFWMRDVGPTFVLDPERPTTLGAVDWVFNGWGAPAWAQWQLSAKIGEFVGEQAKAEVIPSQLVAEGGGLHVDGEGTVLLTETVQLDPRRNPHLTRQEVEAELKRTLGIEKAIWIPRGLSRDYEAFGTNGHIDMVATFASPGVVLLHHQPDPQHPDYLITKVLRQQLEQETDAQGRPLTVIDLPAPPILRDDEGFVDYSYVNHVVVNGGVIACGFGHEEADARAREILAQAYPGRRVVTVNALQIFARGGGIHCITQQQPALVVPDEAGPGSGAAAAPSTPGSTAAPSAAAAASADSTTGSEAQA